MQTQCPQCQTVFRVTGEQLGARDGLVRCSRCLKVFNAPDHPFHGRMPEADGIDEEIVLESPGAAAVMPDSGPAATPATEVLTERVTRTEPSAPAGADDTSDDLPTLAELLWGKPRSRTRPLFWWLGNLALLTILIGQFTWFYATELGRRPELEPWVATFCHYTGCVIQPQQDIGLIELSNTRVAPHSRYGNVLRLRGSIINRAAFTQAWPLVEVSLIDGRGQVVARRTFTADQYRKQPDPEESQMDINVRFALQLDFTLPDKRPGGYEVRLVAPPREESRPKIFDRFFRN